MSSKFNLKITLPIALISALAIGLTAFLNIGKFDRTLGELERSRLQLLLEDIKTNLETGLTLGLPLKSLENAQSVIDSQAKDDPNILAILVHDENGLVLFHSGTEKIAATIPQAWQLAAKGSGERNWYLKDEDGLVVASTLAGGISQDLGGVAIRYSNRAHQNTVRAVQYKLALASLATILITVLMSYVGVSLLTRKTDQKLAQMKQRLDKPDLVLSNKEGNPDLAILNEVIHTAGLAMRDMAETEHEFRTAIAAQSEQTMSAARSV